MLKQIEREEAMVASRQQLQYRRRRERHFSYTILDRFVGAKRERVKLKEYYCFWILKLKEETISGEELKIALLPPFG